MTGKSGQLQLEIKGTTAARFNHLSLGVTQLVAALQATRSNDTTWCLLLVSGVPRSRQQADAAPELHLVEDISHPLHKFSTSERRIQLSLYEPGVRPMDRASLAALVRDACGPRDLSDPD